MKGKEALEKSHTQRSEIAQRIINMITSSDGKTLEWHKCWNVGDLTPKNLDGRKYHGINRMHLALTAYKYGYTDPRWLTFEQAKKNKSQVKKGEKSTYIELWGSVMLDKDGHPTSSKEEAVDSVPVLKRMFSVFNAEQVNGIDPLAIKDRVSDAEWFSLADEYISSSECPVYESKKVARDSSCYHVGKDAIYLPPRTAFDTSADFLSTLWHEMAHSTGTPTRLNRFSLAPSTTVGYAQEELVAELSCVLMQAEAGVEDFGHTMEKNSAAYLKSWLKPIASIHDKDTVEKTILKTLSMSERVVGHLLEEHEKQQINLVNKDIVSHTKSVDNSCAGLAKKTLACANSKQDGLTNCIEAARATNTQKNTAPTRSKISSHNR